MNDVFGKFLKLSPTTIGVLCTLAIVAAFAFIPSIRKRWTTRMLVRAALCIALSFVLSYIRLYRMPQGGSITPASMLPVMLFAYIYGAGPGIIAGAAYGMLNLLQDFYVTSPMSLILDYPLAYAMLGLVGFFNKSKQPYIGMILAVFGRFVCHFLSGYIFFGSYAPEGMHPAVYSLVYNGTYLSVDLVICLVVAIIPPVNKWIQSMKKAEVH